LVYLTLRVKSDNDALKSALITLTLILLGSAGLVLILYEVGSWRDYRVLTPSILLVILMLPILVFQRTFLTLVCIVQVISTAIFIPTILDFREYNYLTDDVHAHGIRDAITTHVYFDESDNRWCNTLLLADTVFGKAAHTEIWRVPAGIGISHVHDFAKLELPIKSKYVFLSESASSSSFYSEQLSERIVSLAVMEGHGVLFKNLDAKCI
jgi:hypothetical protein